MVVKSKSAVVQAFLADHQQFMKLLYEVGAALNAGDVERARQLGAELDRVAGPHIAFEESVLYPAIDKQTQDRSFVPRLYDEHTSIVRALSKLLATGEVDQQGLGELQTAFAEGLGHAEHCGTLISRLSALDPVDQQQALDELHRLRASNQKWTQLKKEA